MKKIIVTFGFFAILVSSCKKQPNTPLTIEQANNYVHLSSDKIIDSVGIKTNIKYYSISANSGGNWVGVDTVEFLDQSTIKESSFSNSITFKVDIQCVDTNIFDENSNSYTRYIYAKILPIQDTIVNGSLLIHNLLSQSLDTCYVRYKCEFDFYKENRSITYTY